MNRFSLPSKDFDLEMTMTCGQTFCWNRTEGELYGEGSSTFYSFQDGKPMIVTEEEEKIVIETELGKERAVSALGLDRDLEYVFQQFPEDEVLDLAKDNFWGLRIIQDEFFPCLISYLCSPQMRIPRIKKMHNKIAERWGTEENLNGETVHRFPTPRELSEASEEELRDIGVGYRAEYIVETTEQVLDGEVDPEGVKSLDYFEAREELKKLHGVGDKVADCVLLFSLGFVEAAPIDTWAGKALKQHYPELHSSKYEEMSENLRDYFGEHAGYAQEYIFHAARNGKIEV